MSNLEALRREHRRMQNDPPVNPAVVREAANQLYEAGATTRAPLDREELRSMRRYWLDWLQEPIRGDLIKPYEQTESPVPPPAQDIPSGPAPAAQADQLADTLLQKLTETQRQTRPDMAPHTTWIRNLVDVDDTPVPRTIPLIIVLVAVISVAALALGLFGLLTGYNPPPPQTIDSLPLTATAIVRQAVTPLILGPTSGEPLRPDVITFSGLGMPGTTIQLLEGLTPLGHPVEVGPDRGWRVDLDLREREGVLTVTAAVVALEGEIWTPQAFSPPVTLGLMALPEAAYTGKLDYLEPPSAELTFSADTSTTSQEGIVSGGTIDVRAAIEAVCDGETVGFTSAAPSVRVTLEGDAVPTLRFFFLPDSLRGDSDTTLVIYTPDERWYCDDDSGGSQQPMITFETPSTGDYLVWVGSFNKGSSISGILYITQEDIGPADVF